MPDRTTAPSVVGTERPVALITGASSGIGAATAARLASGGNWRLLLNGRDEARLARIASETAGTSMPMELSDPAGCERLARQALGRTGRVDAVITGAGIGWAGAFAEMPPSAIDRVLAVNVSAVLHLVRCLLPGMISAGSGYVVLIGSIAGRVGVREEAVYSATKGAVAAFAESLRYELAGTGVRVSMIVPGAVDTPYFVHRGVPYRRSRPRPVPPERVADAVWEALGHGRSDLFVPPWLGIPARLHGMTPGLFRKLAGRFG